MNSIEIRKSPLACFDWYDGLPWQWSCSICHYGEHMPWRDVASFEDAWAWVDHHIRQHRIAGQSLAWNALRDTVQP